MNAKQRRKVRRAQLHGHAPIGPFTSAFLALNEPWFGGQACRECGASARCWVGIGPTQWYCDACFGYTPSLRERWRTWLQRVQRYVNAKASPRHARRVMGLVVSHTINRAIRAASKQ